MTYYQIYSLYASDQDWEPEGLQYTYTTYQAAADVIADLRAYYPAGQYRIHHISSAPLTQEAIETILAAPTTRQAYVLASQLFTVDRDQSEKPHGASRGYVADVGEVQTLIQHWNTEKRAALV